MPFFISEAKEVWEARRKSTKGLLSTLESLANAFFTYNNDWDIDDSSFLIFILPTFLVIDAFVIFRVWFYKGIKPSPNNQIRWYLKVMIYLKYCYLNNHFMIEIAKGFNFSQNQKNGEKVQGL